MCLMVGHIETLDDPKFGLQFLPIWFKKVFLVYDEEIMWHKFRASMNIWSPSKTSGSGPK